MIDELAAALRRDDDRPAVLRTTRSGRTVVRATRGELAALADDYAGGLRMRGLSQGDTIGVAVRPGARSLAILVPPRRLGCISATRGLHTRSTSGASLISK